MFWTVGEGDEWCRPRWLFGVVSWRRVGLSQVRHGGVRLSHTGPHCADPRGVFSSGVGVFRPQRRRARDAGSVPETHGAGSGGSASALSRLLSGDAGAEPDALGRSSAETRVVGTIYWRPLALCMCVAPAPGWLLFRMTAEQRSELCQCVLPRTDTKSTACSVVALFLRGSPRDRRPALFRLPSFGVSCGCTRMCGLASHAFTLHLSFRLRWRSSTIPAQSDTPGRLPSACFSFCGVSRPTSRCSAVWSPLSPSCLSTDRHRRAGHRRAGKRLADVLPKAPGTHRHARESWNFCLARWPLAY